ncbi:MAG: bifunctional orotidine-5'-phosphate decarboxylase/orotate phosphoribosyltransferase, partial [Chloroflexi bacterium]|nr:bifunctional orotidine-5'-phosphate decarboxylase/orotate phosphoribosyltransferase [Chloroflexota bacterium]
LAALPYAALPIATTASLLGKWSMVYPRKEEKDYGTKALVEGVFSEGEKAVVIDDLITSGTSKLEGINKLSENGLIVEDIVVLIDRSKNASYFLRERGYQLHAFLTISELLSNYLDAGLITRELVNKVQHFIEDDQ